jgi:hypothetical protein
MTGKEHIGASADMTASDIMATAYAQAIKARVIAMGYFIIRRAVKSTSAM